MTATITPTLLTAEDFAALPPPPDGARQELVQGVVITMPPPKGRHAIIVSRVSWHLNNLVIPNDLGWVTGETGVHTERDPDTMRGPDVAFWSRARQPDEPVGYFPTPPDLVVEVLSPDDRKARVREKIREYVAAGVPLVWLVDPEVRTVTVYTGRLRGTELDETDQLDGGDVLPGFACRVGDLFPPPRL